MQKKSGPNHATIAHELNADEYFEDYLTISFQTSC